MIKKIIRYYPSLPQNIKNLVESKVVHFSKCWQVISEVFGGCRDIKNEVSLKKKFETNISACRITF